MKRRKINRHQDEVMVFPLSLPMRTALWVALDLLNFLAAPYNPAAVAPISAALYKLDGDPTTVEIDLSPQSAVTASVALDAAVAYLDGLPAYLPDRSPEFTRLAAELRAHSPIIRNLRQRFRECVRYLQAPH